MTLRDQKDPVVTIGKEKGKSQGIGGVEDDEVVCDLNNRTTWHISRDNVCTRTEVTQLGLVCGRSNDVTFGLVCTYLAFDFALTRRPISLSWD